MARAWYISCRLHGSVLVLAYFDPQKYTFRADLRIHFCIYFANENLKKKHLTSGILLRSVNFKMSFWCHRLDQNTNEKIDKFLP